MSFTAFQPSGNTVLIVASSSTSAAATQVCTGGQQGMRIVNASTASLTVFVAAGSSTVQASVPTTAGNVGMCLPATRDLVIATPPAGWLSVATTAGGCNVFATPGFFG